MKNFTKILSIAAIAISATLVAPLAGSAKDGDPIKLGVTLPLSGPGAFDGQLYRNGMNVMLKMINAKGGVLGRPMEAIYYDDRGAPEEAVSVTKLAIERDAVDFVIGGVFSRTGLATKEVTRGRKLNIMLTAQHPDILKQGHEWLFRIIPSQLTLAEKFVGVICDTLKPKRIAYISINDDFGRLAPSNYEAGLKACGVEIVGNEIFNTADVDFVSPLTNLKGLNPDLLFIITTNTSQTATIVRQSRQLGFRGMIAVAPGNVNQKLIELAGSALNGTYSELLYAPDSTNPTAVAWREAYLKEFGSVPSVYGAIAAEAVEVLAAGITNAQSVDDYAKIAASLKRASVPTLMGDVTFDPSGQAQQSFLIVKIVDGKIVTEKVLDSRS